MAKVYIACPWVRKQDAIKAAEQFRAAGITITSRWFEHEGDPNDCVGSQMPDTEVRKQALQDIADVHNSDMIVVMNQEKSEGKAVETGLAIAYGIPVVYIGPRSNIFQVLGVHTHSVAEAIDVVRARFAIPA